MEGKIIMAEYEGTPDIFSIIARIQKLNPSQGNLLMDFLSYLEERRAIEQSFTDDKIGFNDSIRETVALNEKYSRMVQYINVYGNK